MDSSSLLLTKDWASPPKSSSTTLLPRSTKFAGTSTSGELSPIPTTGALRRKRPCCSSTGSTTSSAITVPSSVRSKRLETRIWLTEVAPKLGQGERLALSCRCSASLEANPELLRVALKLATGASKTTVMAMIIAWQTINAVRHLNSRRFTRGFLVVTPGLTIRDRLRVLQPNDPDSYYASRELAPTDMLGDLQRAKIVITNYHSLRPRERLSISSGGRNLLQGRGEPIEPVETEGQMMQRVMPELMGLKNIMVLNEEGHHCYRQKPGEDDEGPLTGEDKREANQNTEEARVWLSGLEMTKRKLGVRQVVDLSPTPFFLRGSGYAEGTLFPWTAQRLLAHGRHRMRHRQAPTGSSGGQYPGSRCAGVP